MFRLIYLSARILLSLLLLFPGISYSQNSKDNVSTQRLWLKLGACYLNVAWQNQIDIDSGMSIAGKQNHLDGMLVIGENFDDIYPDKNGKWIAEESISKVKQLALSGNGYNSGRLLSLIGYYYSFQPGGKKRDIDSAIYFFSKAKQKVTASADNKTFIQILYCMMKCNLETMNLVAADSLFKLALDMADRTNDKHGEATARLYWGTFSPFQVNTVNTRIEQLKKADTLFQQLKDKENEIYTTTNIGYLSFAAGKLKESKNAFLKALEIEQSIGFQQTQYTNDLLAFIAQIQGEYGTTLKYSLMALKAAEATKDIAAYPYVCSRLANSYSFFNDKQQEALTWLQKALTEFEKIGANPVMFSVLEHICKILRTNNRYQEVVNLVEDILKRFPPTDPNQKRNSLLILAENYIGLNKFSIAQQYASEAEKLESEVSVLSGNIQLPYINYRLGFIYFSMKQFERSRPYFNKVLVSPEGIPKEFLGQAERALSIIDSAKGDFKNAYSHSKKYMALKESVLNDNQTKQTQQLMVQYETEKKDYEIKLLGQQSALQRSQIKQDRFIKSIIIGALIILALFLVLLYNRFRLKQKTNKQLESQQKEIAKKNITLQHLVEEKEWLLKEVHHRVKNNLQTVVSLLELQSENLRDEALSAIQDSQNRIFAMSLIHQKLYQTENIASINMQPYLLELVNHMQTIYNPGYKINFELQVAAVGLDVSQAIPVGLIVNEAVTNSIKYAFNYRVSYPEISISLRQYKKNSLKLTVADNGIGLPPDFNIEEATGLGFKLIKGLVDDIEGELIVETEQGIIVTVVFNASVPFDEKAKITAPEKTIAV